MVVGTIGIYIGYRNEGTLHMGALVLVAAGLGIFSGARGWRIPPS